MNFKPNTFLFALGTFLLICVFPFVANAQLKRTSKQTTCDSEGWQYRTAKLGQPETKIEFIKSGVDVEVRDENGKAAPQGGYIHVTNGGDQAIQWRELGTEIWFDVEAGGEGEQGPISIYRTKKDRTPTRFNVEFRYKCDTKVAKKTKPKKDQVDNQSQANTQSPQQQTPVNQPPQPVYQPPTKTAIQANQPFPVGCWKFTYVDDPLRTESKIFKADGTVVSTQLTTAEGAISSSKYGTNVNPWTTRGDEINITNSNNSYIEVLRFDGNRLRGWYDNANGDTPSNMRYYGTKDITCSGIKP